MLAGIIDNENYSQVLREIAKQRRQGILSLRFPQNWVDVVFVQGKVVDVRIEGRNRVLEVRRYLVDLFKLPQDCQQGAGSGYFEIWEGLTPEMQEQITEERFRKIIERSLHDDLIQIDWIAGALFEFKVQSVEYDKDYCPTISVGQLLLDLASFQVTSERFNQIFFRGCSVQSIEGKAVVDSDDHARSLILKQLNDPLTIEQLRWIVMLNRSRLQEELLALYDQERVRVLEGENKLNSIEPNVSIEEAPQSNDRFSCQQEHEPDVKEPEMYKSRDCAVSSTEGSETPAAPVLLNAYMENAVWLPSLIALLFLVFSISVPLHIWSYREVIFSF